MKFQRRNQQNLRLSVLALVGLILADCCPLAWPATTLAQPSNRPTEEDIFTSSNLLRISIVIPEAGLQRLRQSRRGLQKKPQAEATVTESGRVYRKVVVQLKGYTSFRSIDDSPSLTLKFDKLVSNQNFHGLTKISLNNSAQDSTRQPV